MNFINLAASMPGRFRAISAGIVMAIFLLPAAHLMLVDQAASAADPAQDIKMRAGDRTRMMQFTLPIIDPKRGRQLFVTRGCVLCHAINNTGGRGGPPLDRIGDGKGADILDFTARMWRGAYAMIELQNMELGYQLDFSGEELGHIIAFLYDKSERSRFSAKDVPDLIKDMFIDQPYNPNDDDKSRKR
ncbi:MAG: c-type cytochrome [Alphaproteobacteria bacterium]|nr:c-type cytochrome [Alphaproteobacteria bacterium]